MRIARGHWVMALLMAVLVHAGMAVALLRQPPDSESGAKSAGLGGIEVSLGPAGGAPGSESRLVEEVAEAETEVPAQAEPSPWETTVASPDPARQEPVDTASVEFVEQPVELVEGVVDAEPASPRPVEETTTVPAVEASPVEAIEQQSPLPKHEEVAVQPKVVPPPPKPKPRPVEPPRAASPTPEPVEQAPRQSAMLAASAEDQIAAIAPSAPGAGGRARSKANPGAGNADDRAGGGMPGEMADYMAQLQSWLGKHKKYPRRAQSRRQEGTALLYFVMDRDGRVLEYRLEQSSGHGLLDRETIAMIERAQPLPKMPEDMHQSRMELVVPVQFILR